MLWLNTLDAFKGYFYVQLLIISLLSQDSGSMNSRLVILIEYNKSIIFWIFFSACPAARVGIIHETLFHVVTDKLHYKSVAMVEVFGIYLIGNKSQQTKVSSSIKLFISK